MFKRGIRVCTGTGIGAALSTCIQSPNWYVAIPTSLSLTPRRERGNRPPRTRPPNLTGRSSLLARFLIWIGSDQERTFGPTITGLIYKHIEPERMILWDTKKRGGRPDTMKLIRETWVSFGAEAIFITSNKQGNDEMMRGCRKGAFFYTPY